MPKPRQLSSEEKNIISAALEGRGQDWYRTSLIVKDLADVFQVSKQTIYKISRDVRSRRKKRKDSREAPKRLTKKQFQDLCAVTIRYDVPALESIAIAEKLKLIPAGAMTPENFNRWLRKIGLARRRKRQEK